MVEDARPYWARELTDEVWHLADRGYFRVEAAAAYLGVSPRFIYGLTYKDQMPCRKIGRFVTFRKEDLDAYMNRT